MEQMIQVIIVIIFFISGASMALRPNLWKDWIANIETYGVNSVLSLGLVNLLLGSIIVTFHWVWEGFSTIITIIGIIMIFRSFMMLIMPKFVLKMIKYMLPKMNFIISISGFLIIIIAALLFHKLNIETGLVIVPENMYFFVKN